MIENTVFKPSLLSRVFEGFFNGMNGIIEQSGGATQPIEQVVNSSFSPGFLKRSLLRLLIFDLAMVTSLMLIKAFSLDMMIMAYKSKEGNATPPFSVRYMRLVVIYLIFLLMSLLVYEFVLSNILYLVVKFYVHYVMTRDPSSDAGALTKQVWEGVWNTFAYFSPKGQVEIGNTNMFVTVLLSATAGLFLFFMVYTLFVKSVVNKLQYPEYQKSNNVSDEDYDAMNMEGEQDERTGFKFIVHQSVMTTFVILFGIGFVMAHHISDASLRVVISSIFLFVLLFVYAMFYCIAMKYQLQNYTSSFLKGMLWLLTYVWIVYLVL